MILVLDLQLYERLHGLVQTVFCAQQLPVRQRSELLAELDRIDGGTAVW